MSHGNEPKKIFDVNDYRRLKRLQKELNEFAELVEKCQQCGISCPNECEQIEGGRYFAEKLEEVFFNPPPSEIAQLME